MRKLKALFIHGEKHFESVFGPEEQAEIGDLVDIYAPRQTSNVFRDDPEILAPAEVLITGGSPARLDKPYLDLVPHLEVVFHCAASIRKIISDAFWRKKHCHYERSQEQCAFGRGIYPLTSPFLHEMRMAYREFYKGKP